MSPILDRETPSQWTTAQLTVAVRFVHLAPAMDTAGASVTAERAGSAPPEFGEVSEQPGPAVPDAPRLAQALAAAQAIQDEYTRALALSDVAARLPVDQQPAVLAQALAAAQAIQDESSRAEALSAVAARLPADQTDLLAQALAAARAIQDEDSRARALSAVAAQPGDPGSQPTAERCALIGSAWKRRAASLAREGKAFDAELASSRDWYARGMGTPGTRKFNAYCALNRVMLDALLGVTGDVDLARKAAAAARERFLASRDYWDAIMPADARLAEALCSGVLEDLAKAENEIGTVLDAYGGARAAVVENTKNWDSVVDQVELLAVFAAARERAVLADSLKAIAARLRPNGGNGGAGRSAPTAPGARAARAPAKTATVRSRAKSGTRKAGGSKRPTPGKARKTKTSRP